MENEEVERYLNMQEPKEASEASRGKRDREIVGPTTERRGSGRRFLAYR